MRGEKEEELRVREGRRGVREKGAEGERSGKSVPIFDDSSRLYKDVLGGGVVCRLFGGSIGV